MDDDRAVRPDTSGLVALAREKLAALERKSLRRVLVPVERGPAHKTARDGRALVDFSSNDYLGLSQHDDVKRAAQDAIARYGTSASGSRLVTGDSPLVHALEARLARHQGSEAALVFGAGYLTNTGAIPALVGEKDAIVLDELAHACLFAGAKLARSEIITVAHNDVRALARALGEVRARVRHCLVVTESVFSMDGDRAPLAELAALARAHDAWLYVDDAHGTYGAHDAPGAFAPLVAGTLSKALASSGGYLAAPRAVVDLLTSRARTLVYSTGLAPAQAAAALAALDVVEREPARALRPLTLARRFARALDLAEPESAIVPLVVGDAARALALQAALLTRGFLVVAIRPPTVPDGTARLRVSFSATHDDETVDALAAAVRSEWTRAEWTRA
jgi:8-amino-7-oxononanoate synthase